MTTITTNLGNVPVGTLTTTTTKGVVQDLDDIISNISPENTPFISSIEKTNVTNKNPSWLTDELSAFSENAQVEGDDAVNAPITPVTELSNKTQILRKVYATSGTVDATNFAGRERELAYLSLKKALETRRDAEYALFLWNIASEENGVRKMAGIPSWMKKENIQFNCPEGAAKKGSGNGSDLPSCESGNALTPSLTNDDFDWTLQQLWQNGAQPDSVYMTPSYLAMAQAWTGSGGPSARVFTDSASGKINKYVAIYESPYGTLKFIPTIYINNANSKVGHIQQNMMPVIQHDMWELGVLRNISEETLAKTGDSDKRMIITEITLKCKNPNAVGGVVGKNAT